MNLKKYISKSFIRLYIFIFLFLVFYYIKIKNNLVFFTIQIIFIMIILSYMILYLYKGFKDNLELKYLLPYYHIYAYDHILRLYYSKVSFFIRDLINRNKFLNLYN